eukprot:TRINITY_DN10308_c0_g1_i1.p1 TRINITY_DN10308_c0_g1~~TRINITY_DN10308_c0_g1_i1.p1  ORF type:complete len:319 (-),score=55.65 TRINITY_DN10308_c0_g1_i1:120-1076(-)
MMDYTIVFELPGKEVLQDGDVELLQTQLTQQRAEIEKLEKETLRLRQQLFQVANEKEKLKKQLMAVLNSEYNGNAVIVHDAETKSRTLWTEHEVSGAAEKQQLVQPAEPPDSAASRLLRIGSRQKKVEAPRMELDEEMIARWQFEVVEALMARAPLLLQVLQTIFTTPKGNTEAIAKVVSLAHIAATGGAALDKDPLVPTRPTVSASTEELERLFELPLPRPAPVDPPLPSTPKRHMGLLRVPSTPSGITTSRQSSRDPPCVILGLSSSLYGTARLLPQPTPHAAATMLSQSPNVPRYPPRPPSVKHTNPRVSSGTAS